MSSQSEVMHCYEQIVPLTERMLVVARTKQWGELPALEEQYSGMIDRLKTIEQLSSLDEAQAARKYRLLGRIKANHAEICSMVMPQLEALGDALKSLERQQSLHKAYGQAGNAYI